eukprot:GILJ01021653.1.p1 GENE.GILJ01021653.1~~GILJ01021653.1.p1  ORF type:complete len:303 (-),score=38.30 GILJ01021653.1:66-974(-)
MHMVTIPTRIGPHPTDEEVFMLTEVWKHHFDSQSSAVPTWFVESTRDLQQLSRSLTAEQTAALTSQKLHDYALRAPLTKDVNLKTAAILKTSQDKLGASRFLNETDFIRQELHHLAGVDLSDLRFLSYLDNLEKMESASFIEIETAFCLLGATAQMIFFSNFGVPTKTVPTTYCDVHYFAALQSKGPYRAFASDTPSDILKARAAMVGMPSTLMDSLEACGDLDCKILAAATFWQDTIKRRLLTFRGTYLESLTHLMKELQKSSLLLPVSQFSAGKEQNGQDGSFSTTNDRNTFVARLPELI